LRTCGYSSQLGEPLDAALKARLRAVLVKVGTKLVDSANRGRELAHRTRRVEREVVKPLLGVLELPAQDQRACTALFEQLASYTRSSRSWNDERASSERRGCRSG